MKEKSDSSEVPSFDPNGRTLPESCRMSGNAIIR